MEGGAARRVPYTCVGTKIPENGKTADFVVETSHKEKGKTVNSRNDNEEDLKFAERCANIGKAREAIVADCGGPWKRGMNGKKGSIDCPVCDGVGTLQYNRSAYNGHICARCSTDGCVAWIE